MGRAVSCCELEAWGPLRGTLPASPFIAVYLPGITSDITVGAVVG